jgi:hypothetical protein
LSAFLFCFRFVFFDNFGIFQNDQNAIFKNLSFCIYSLFLKSQVVEAAASDWFWDRRSEAILIWTYFDKTSFAFGMISVASCVTQVK